MDQEEKRVVSPEQDDSLNKQKCVLCIQPRTYHLLNGEQMTAAAT